MVVRASEVASQDLQAVLRTLKRESNDQTSLYVVVCIEEPTAPHERSKQIASIIDEARAQVDGELRTRERLDVADLQMDRDRFEVSRAGQRIHLSLTEFRLLETLMRHHDRVLDIDFLSGSLFHDTPTQAACNILWVYIHRLRRKVDRPPCIPLIRTIRGRGYVLRSPDLEATAS